MQDKVRTAKVTVGVLGAGRIILPTTIVFLNLLLNDRELLGPNLEPSVEQLGEWSIIGVLYVLSGILATQVIAPGMFPKG